MYTPRYDVALHLDDDFKDKPPCDLVDLISAMRRDLLDYYNNENCKKDPYAKTKNILLRIADLDFHI
jgi:ribosomal protein S15P/S13E